MSLDDDRVRPENFDKLFAQKKVGSTVTFTVLRGERVLNVPVVVGRTGKTEYSIKDKEHPTELQRLILRTWLGEKE